MARTKNTYATDEDATYDAQRARELPDAIADLKEGMGKLLRGLDALHYNLREVELMAQFAMGDRDRELAERELRGLQDYIKNRVRPDEVEGTHERRA